MGSECTPRSSITECLAWLVPGIKRQHTERHSTIRLMDQIVPAQGCLQAVPNMLIYRRLLQKPAGPATELALSVA